MSGRATSVLHGSKTAMPDAGGQKRKAHCQRAEKEALIGKLHILEDAAVRHRSGRRDHRFGMREASHENRGAEPGCEGDDGERGAALAVGIIIDGSGRGRGIVVFHRIVFLSHGPLLCEQVNDPPGKRPDKD